MRPRVVMVQRVILLVTLVLPLVWSQAVADRSPSSCQTPNLQLALAREKPLVVLGGVNTYSVQVTNDDDFGAGAQACDVEDLLVVFCCPDVDGHAPNESPAFDPANPGPLCTVLSDGFGDGVPADRDDFPANFGTRIYPSQECTFDGYYPVGNSNRANIKLQAGFNDLQFGRVHTGPGDDPN